MTTQTETPYCEAQAGGLLCGRPVSEWGQQCDYHSGKTSQPRLTRKQKAFADSVLANPKLSATAAARETYGKPDKPVNDTTAAAIAYENLRKPQIMAYLHGKASMAEETMVEIMEVSKGYAKTGGKEGAAYASVAVSAGKDILDRVHGRATQKVETTSTVLQIGIDLSMLGADQVEEGEIVDS